MTALDLSDLVDLVDPQAVGRWALSTGLEIAFILGVAFLVQRAGRRLLNRFERQLELEDTQAGRDLRRSATLARVCRSAVSVFVWTIVLLTVLKRLIPDIGPMLAGVGIAGLAVGFGAQSMVRDFLGGFFVLLEDQYRVGDLVEIDGVGGVVEHLSLRRTSLRALDGTLHHIPNGDIKLVSNRSAGWSKAIVDVGVPYEEDLHRVRAALVKAGNDLLTDPGAGHLVLEPAEILGVEEFGESQVTVRVSVKTLPGKQVPVGRVLRQRIMEAFDREDISIPFPHRVMIHRQADPAAGGGAAQAEAPARPDAGPEALSAE